MPPPMQPPTSHPTPPPRATTSGPAPTADVDAGSPPGPTGPLDRVLAWFPVAVVGALVLFVLQYAARPVINPDTYFHLRFGEEFRTGAWQPWDPGQPSSFSHADWVPTQWSSQVVLAQVDAWAGLPGVAWLLGAVLVALVLVLYRACRREAGPLVAAPVAAVALLACISGLSARPQLVSYLMVVVTVSAWLRTARDGRARWWLVPLTWVWATAHGMWPVGIATGLVAAAGIALDAPAGRRRPQLRLLGVPVACAVAAALTPAGPRLYAAVLLVGDRSQYFAEWDPPDVTAGGGATVLAVLLAGTLLLLARRRPSWTATLLVLLACGWAAYSSRTVPVAALMAAPVLCGLLADLVPRRPTPRGEAVALGLVAAVGLAVLAVAVPRTSGADSIDQPAWVEPSLDALPSGTRVLNEWNQGGYLLQRFPRLDVVMHGYGDVFTDEEIKRNSDLLDLDPGWDKVVDDLDVQYALLDPKAPLAYAVERLPGWTVVHTSRDLVLLRHTG